MKELTHRGFKDLYDSDIYRLGDCKFYVKRFVFLLRKLQCCKHPLLRCYYLIHYSWLSRKYGLEILPQTQIGKGLYLGHAYNITINPSSVLGNNINLHKGCTIGGENRGKRKGAPIIGDRVWIGVNAAVVGSIRIGDDVLIAPNSFVNCDIPSHSIVFGNPCSIVHRPNATEGYINNIV